PLFFQAEDGIRDFHVTGVQTCALPISHLQPADQDRILYRLSIPLMHWDVAALPVKSTLQQMARDRLLPPLLILLLFSVLTGVLWWVLQRQERRAQQLDAERRNTQRRAERALK